MLFRPSCGGGQRRWRKQGLTFEIYADLHRQGNLIGDAGILIAASALVNGCGVVTNNEKHFQRMSGLHLENWLK
jgi:predicted nucleic acid-binding protein